MRRNTHVIPMRTYNLTWSQYYCTWTHSRCIRDLLQCNIRRIAGSDTCQKSWCEFLHSWCIVFCSFLSFGICCVRLSLCVCAVCFSGFPELYFLSQSFYISCRDYSSVRQAVRSTTFDQFKVCINSLLCRRPSELVVKPATGSDDFVHWNTQHIEEQSSSKHVHHFWESYMFGATRYWDRT